MSDNLYFISIIAKALQEPDIKKALKKAFREIKKKRREKRYAQGYLNFKLFMDTVCSCHETVTNDYIRELIAEHATGTFEGTEQEKKVLTNIICLRPQWMVEYLTICRQEAEEDLTQESFPEIAVLSEEYPARYVSFPKGPARQRLDDILPGNYKLELVNTGWIIWEGQLTGSDLIWTALPMAADTKGVKEKHKREIDLLNNGELILRTYAGKLKGSIEIELTI
jgi:hypothetical protein